MIDFKALAERSVTVQVAGEDVVLRTPRNAGFRKIVHRITALDLKDPASTAEFNELYMELQANALHECVVTDQEVSVEDWLRILYQRRTDLPDGMQDLINEAMRLCGWEPADAGQDRTSAGPDGPPVEDHIGEAADALGKPDLS